MPDHERRSPKTSALLAALADMAQLFWSLGSDARWQPSEGSVAWRDQHEPELVVADWDDVPHLASIVQGSSVGGAISAHDHLSALVRLLEVPSRLYAAQSTMRGLLEVSARCWYITDQTVAPVERARRVLNDIVYGLHEVILLRAGAGVSTVDAEAELEQVLRASAGCGFDVHRSRRNTTAPRVGERRPSSTGLSGLFIGGDDVGSLSFRTTSGVAHGNVTSLLRVAGSGDEVWAALRDPQGSGSLSDDMLQVEYLDAAVAFWRMAVRMSGYFGWSTRDWDGQFNRAFDLWLEF